MSLQGIFQSREKDGRTVGLLPAQSLSRPVSPERRGIKITKPVHSNPQRSIPSSDIF